QTWSGLVRYASLKVADPQEAEDLAMDACVKLFGRWSKRRPENPTAWAFAVLGNSTRNRARLGRRRHAELGDDVIDLGEERDLDLIEAIKQLPARQREAIALRYLADLRQADVALVMGVADGTASALLTQGRANLRKRLGQ